MYQHNAQFAPAAMGYAPRGYAQMGLRPQYDIMGVDPADQTTWQKITAWGDKETAGVKNKWLVAAAAVLGIGWYGYYAGWFGR